MGHLRFQAGFLKSPTEKHLFFMGTGFLWWLPLKLVSEKFPAGADTAPSLRGQP